MPVLEVNGEQIAQSNAILVYTGKVHLGYHVPNILIKCLHLQLAGLYPIDPVEAAEVHEVLHTFDDIVLVQSPLWTEQTLEGRQAAAETMCRPDGILTTWLARVDKLLSHNSSGFAAGRYLDHRRLSAVESLQLDLRLRSNHMFMSSHV